MGWGNILYRNLSSAAFDSLNDYCQLMESQLTTLKRDEQKRIEENIRGLKLSSDEEYAEWSMETDNLTSKYNMLYTNFFRYSFVVLLFLLLDDWLHRLCLAVLEIKSLPTPPVADRDKLRVYKKYLAEANVTVADNLWEFAFDLQKVRDCVVHTSGNVSRSRDKNQLRILVKRKMGIEISTRGYYRDEEEPLYLEENTLIVKSDYCRSTILAIKSLIDKLCNAIPLEKVDFGKLFAQDNRVITDEGRMRLKFHRGQRVIGNDKKAAYRQRRGTVVKYGPGKGEYLVRFDDGQEEYVNTEWLGALNKRIKE